MARTSQRKAPIGGATPPTPPLRTPSAAAEPTSTDVRFETPSVPERLWRFRLEHALRARRGVARRGWPDPIRPIPSWKWCPSCRQSKVALDFYYDHRAAQGLWWQCKPCQRLARRMSWLLAQNESGLSEHHQHWLDHAFELLKGLGGQLADARLDVTDPASLELRARRLRRVGDLTWRLSVWTVRAHQDRLVAEGKKLCTRCGNVKALQDFHRNRHSTDGRHWWCRVCASGYSKVRRAAKLARRGTAR